MASCLEPASRGQRSPPGPAGTVVRWLWELRAELLEQPAGRPSSGKFGPAAAASWAPGGRQGPDPVPFPGHCSHGVPGQLLGKRTGPLGGLLGCLPFQKVSRGPEVGLHLPGLSDLCRPGQRLDWLTGARDAGASEAAEAEVAVPVLFSFLLDVVHSNQPR